MRNDRCILTLQLNDGWRNKSVRRTEVFSKLNKAIIISMLLSMRIIVWSCTDQKSVGTLCSWQLEFFSHRSHPQLISALISARKTYLKRVRVTQGSSEGSYSVERESIRKKRRICKAVLVLFRIAYWIYVVWKVNGI